MPSKSRSIFLAPFKIRKRIYKVLLQFINICWRAAELAIDKKAQTLLMPVSARRQLNDLPDELWTKLSIEFYKDGADAVFKALME